MKNTTHNTKMINWVIKRIETTTKEKAKAKDIEIVKSKGCKLTAYKEVLEHLRSHDSIKERFIYELLKKFNASCFLGHMWSKWEIFPNRKVYGWEQRKSCLNCGLTKIEDI